MSNLARELAARKRSKKKEPTFRQRVEAGRDNVVRGAKQAVAGLLETTIAPTGPNSMRPAIVDAIPGTVGLVAALMGRKPPAIPGVVDTGKALERLNYASQHVNNYLGTTDPRDATEMAIRIGGSLIVPGPKGAGIAKAAGTASRAEKVIRGTGRIVGEAALPLRQTGKKGTAVIVGAGTALREGADALQVQGSEEDRKYNSVAESVGGTTLDPMSDEDFENMLFEDLEEDPDEAFQAAIEAPVTDDEEIFDVEDEQDNSTFVNAALAVGAVLGGVVAIRTAKSFVDTRLAGAPEQSRIRFTGKMFRNTDASVSTQAKAALAQQDAPIRDMAAEHLGRAFADRWGYRSDRTVNAATASKLHHQFVTGETVGSTVRTQPLAPIARAYADELTPDEQILLSDGLNAASSIDTLNAKGAQTSLNLDRAGQATTQRDLQAKVQAVTSNPKLLKYYDMIQQSYRDMAKYQLDRGLLSPDDYQKLTTMYPNYVNQRRNLQTDYQPTAGGQSGYSADRLSVGASRSSIEGGGVQGTTGVADPFVSLFDEWKDIVRQAEHNELRADFLVNMDATRALNSKGKPIIQRVSNSATGDNVHTVFVNGKTQKYRVQDPLINRTLHMHSRMGVKVLESMRQIDQSTITGIAAAPFNAFAVTASPVYDTFAALLNRPKGVLVNPFGAYPGAARYAWGAMTEAVAGRVASHMIRDQSWLRDALGSGRLQALSDLLNQSVKNSSKAEADRLGITSKTMFGSPDPAELLTGVEKVAPKFSRGVLSHANADIREAMAKGDIGTVRGLLMQTGNMFAKTRATGIANMIDMVVESMHNGMKMSVYAMNKGRMADDQLASTIRRISGDPAQHGGSDLVNATAGAIPYANLSLQTLYEWGKLAKSDPKTWLFNASTTVLGLAALKYTALASDPEILDRYENMSPAERARVVIAPGGFEIKIDPNTRMLTSLLFPVYDEMSGINSGEFDPNFMTVMDNWLSGDMSFDEEAMQNWKSSLNQSASDAWPFHFNSIPIVKGGLAINGVDVGMTRMTDNLVMPMEQDVTGLDVDKRRKDSMVSAQMEARITGLANTTGRSMLTILDDVQRAYRQKGDASIALDVGLQRWRDGLSKNSGVFRPLLFSNYTNQHSSVDANHELLTRRSEGIEAAIGVLTRDVRREGRTADGRGDFTRVMPVEEGVAPPEIVGTELKTITDYTWRLQNKYIKDYKDQISAVSQQIDAYNNQYGVTPESSLEKRNAKINDLIKERKYLRMMMLNTIRDTEEQIANDIGRPFTYDGFVPEEYMKPTAPVQ